MHQKLFLGMFVGVNFWTIFVSVPFLATFSHSCLSVPQIHDSDMITGHPLETVINGPAHHTLHHLYFTVNYGQYFTFSDRWGGSYRQPAAELDPMLEVKRLEAQKKKQALGKDS